MTRKRYVNGVSVSCGLFLIISMGMLSGPDNVLRFNWAIKVLYKSVGVNGFKNKVFVLYVLFKLIGIFWRGLWFIISNGVFIKQMVASLSGFSIISALCIILMLFLQFIFEFGFINSDKMFHEAFVRFSDLLILFW